MDQTSHSMTMDHSSHSMGMDHDMPMHDMCKMNVCISIPIYSCHWHFT